MSDILDNYSKLFFIIRGPATQALRALMTYYLKKCGLTFQEFIDANQHAIYHLYNHRRCCQCPKHYMLGNTSRTPIPIAQMEIMFDTNSQRKNSHVYSKKDICCCYAKCQICVDDVDITLLRILLNNVCDLFFWTRYLDIEHSGNFELFLKNKRHELFHLWKHDVTCCKCNEHKDTYKRPKKSEINQQEFESLYTFDRTIKAVECTLDDTCTYSARQGISQVDMRDTKLFQTIRDRFCSPRKEINSIVKTRNKFSHSTDIKEEEFKKRWSTLRENVKRIECITESKLWTKECIDILEQKLDLKNSLKEIKTDLGKSILNGKRSLEILQQIEQRNRESKTIFQKSTENNPAQSFTSVNHMNFTESSICLHPKQFKLKLSKLYKDIDCEIEEAEKRLKENCRHLNLTFRNETPRNGNCFFDAVSSQLRDLGLRERSAEEMRQNVIDYLMENRKFQGVDGDVNVEHFIDNSTFEDWASNMRRNGVFADHVVVLGMARMLETNMLTVTSNPQSNPENCMTHIVGKMDYDKMPIILGHVWENHYRSLISLDATIENDRLVQTDWCKIQPRNRRPSLLCIHRTTLNEIEMDSSPSDYEVTRADTCMTLIDRTVMREMTIKGKGKIFAPDVREIEIPSCSSDSLMSNIDGGGDSDCDDDDLFVCGKCRKFFKTNDSLVTHKTESVRCMQRKRKNVKKTTDTSDISSEHKRMRTSGEPKEKRFMLMIRMEQTRGEMEPSWKHHVKRVQRTCTGNLDVNEDIIVQYIEEGSLVFWTKTNASTVKNNRKFTESMDRFIVNLLQKCPIDTKDEPSFSFRMNVVESSEDEDSDDEDENDLFICGRCGTTFNSFSSFTSHKRNFNLICKKKRADQQHKDDGRNSKKKEKTPVKEELSENLSQCADRGFGTKMNTRGLSKKRKAISQTSMFLEASSRQEETQFDLVDRRAGSPKIQVSGGTKYLNTNIQILVGNIVLQEADVLVYSSPHNLKLNTGKGLSTEILNVAGSDIQDELDRMSNKVAECGTFAVTNGYNLRCSKVYHGYLPSFCGRNNRPEKVLSTFVSKCLIEANTHKAKCVVFSTLGIGMLRYPIDVAASAVIKGIQTFVSCNPTSNYIDNIKIIVYGGDSNHSRIEQAYKSELTTINSAKGINLKNTTNQPIPRRGTKVYFCFKYNEEPRPPTNWSFFKSFRTIKDWSKEYRGRVTIKKQRIDKNTFEAIKNLFMKTIKNPNAKIKSITRNENLNLYLKYFQRCQELFRKAMVNGPCKPLAKPVLTMANLNRQMRGVLEQAINEVYLFHGTKQNRVKVLLRNGFDERLASMNFAKLRLGNGTYTAEEASLSSHYTEPQGVRTMFLVRACLGDVFRTKENLNDLKRPPCKKMCKTICTQHDEFFDSVLGEFCPREFVVYEKAQCYPEYVIKYTL